MEIVPHVGIGKVRLGMSQEEADWHMEPGMQLDYAGDPPVVTFIQVTDVCYRDIDLCFDPADEVLAAIVRLEGLDPAEYPPGRHEYRFPHLNMFLWRGRCPTSRTTRGTPSRRPASTRRTTTRTSNAGRRRHWGH